MKQEDQPMPGVNSAQYHLIRYKEGLGKYKENMPELTHAYNEFTRHCFKEGEISEKNKQLIALGISIYSQDEYCIIYHTKGCLDQGCSENEILEAVGVSAAFGGGAAMSQGVTLVQECINELKKPRH
ncbi:carboxymuconolactone decarboxylase family protein [Fictibacillus phosphorivorans]|uniref:carboxymuconolactone decarboxylase family protein n=1 Tax=Fictibacillus phosphorivorans TaxID=1221500 RepID=UPI0020416B58|nr:carboxymuconolactone decarboxylase family protein [Fictibacillus phosphorivorans]MCM3718818.1 carboxymuconolactone decarboxylase family protein [Fictibacillus phosphorivorans]MCM3776441.1 carboxymuconolactone decarboxylase family protein [Fictibacillus phosphorivorans]